MNTDTPTPRTESFIDKQLTEWPLWDWQDHASAYADFARTLERECREANRQLEELSVRHGKMMDELAALRRDKERLDWLEASPYRHVEGDYWDTGNPYWRCQDRKNVNTIACIGPDIRAAIDAAIAQEDKT